TRRRDLLVTDERLFAFFDDRLDESVVSARHFERWWAKVRRDRPDLLTFTLDDLVDPSAEPVDPESFPTTWRQGDVTLDLDYRFSPGDEDDGVTVEVPLTVLGR